MAAAFDNKLTEYCDLVNHRLEQMRSMYSEDNAGYQIICPEAMWYSLSAGGKRIRPILVMEFCRIFGGDINIALDTACALEMIHTFSLIHDDLPCMDNDDYRRGQLSCHKKYGEAEALLAGDALENLAFEIISSDEHLTEKQRVDIIRVLSRAVGVLGMIGGQIIDIRNDGRAFEPEKLLAMYSMKTGALLRAACSMGCICAGAYDRIPDAEAYADDLGLAFQIIDDILDITATSDELGKPVGSDEEQGKATYPHIFGLEAAMSKAEELTENALSTTAGFPDNEFLNELTEYLLKRTK
ncbi:MAG: polyprenyl synthetase family protein [Huintestinicola sp.]